MIFALYNIVKYLREVIFLNINSAFSAYIFLASHKKTIAE